MSSEEQKPQNPNLYPELDEARQYVETVRELYREGKASYAGRRNEEQEVIAELAGEEARLMVDGAAAGIAIITNSELSDDFEDIEYAGIPWKKFRGEFERLLIGFGVITNRLHRDEAYDIPDYLELDDETRHKTAAVLFNDFLAHNALRFGVDGSGVRRSYSRHTEDGGIVREIRDIDVARSEKELRHNMASRGYHSGVSTHAAGKMSPDAYRHLRRQFPEAEIEKDKFDQGASGYRNFEAELAKLGE